MDDVTVSSLYWRDEWGNDQPHFLGVFNWINSKHIGRDKQNKQKNQM